MQCTPCWLLICQDQSTGYAATYFPHTPEMIIPLPIIRIGKASAPAHAPYLHPCRHSEFQIFVATLLVVREIC